eukprot:m.90266 g.90266  ORF g.90266 m.90266 type:complete len:129 (+) comp26379_c1_seq1:938-1324(+)
MPSESPNGFGLSVAVGSNEYQDSGKTVLYNSLYVRVSGKITIATHTKHEHNVATVDASLPGESCTAGLLELFMTLGIVSVLVLLRSMLFQKILSKRIHVLIFFQTNRLPLFDIISLQEVKVVLDIDIT